ncbi:Uncharacterised protein [Klebsiella pneumoniae]|nr:Uncharacterised protein [Klebsiella pneumoniae]
MKLKNILLCAMMSVAFGSSANTTHKVKTNLSQTLFLMVRLMIFVKMQASELNLIMIKQRNW